MVDRLVVLAASLGGPHLVNAILSALDEDYALPVVVFQQMEHDFSEPLTGAWGKTCPLNVVRLSQTREVGRATVYIMPHGAALMRENAGAKMHFIPTYSSAALAAADLWKSAVRTTLDHLTENDIVVLLSDAPDSMVAFRSELRQEQKTAEILIYAGNAREHGFDSPGVGPADSETKFLSIDRIVAFLNALSAEARARLKSEQPTTRRARV